MTADNFKVLNIVGVMRRAGTETWLMNLLRTDNNAIIRMDFLVHRENEGDYDEEILSYGSNITVCLNARNPFKLFGTFLKIKNKTPYDVVHCHMSRFSWYYLVIARMARVGKKYIAHNHTDERPSSTDVRRSRFNRFQYYLTRQSADLCLACSKAAAECMAGKRWSDTGKTKVQYLGIPNLKEDNVSADTFRSKLGIPKDCLLLCHVGRFDPVKNHEFLLKICQELRNGSTKFKIMLIGDGPLLETTKAQINLLQLSEHVIFLGSIPNATQYLTFSDVFLFPSKFEGFGLALLEAQSVGVKCIISNYVPTEAVIFSNLVTQLPFEAKTWAAHCITPHPVKFANYANRTSFYQKEFEDSKFTILASLNSLRETYRKISLGEK